MEVYVVLPSGTQEIKFVNQVEEDLSSSVGFGFGLLPENLVVALQSVKLDSCGKHKMDRTFACKNERWPNKLLNY